jgi:hypothetical protein
MDIDKTKSRMLPKQGFSKRFFILLADFVVFASLQPLESLITVEIFFDSAA